MTVPHDVRLNRHRWARLAEVNDLPLPKAAAWYAWCGLPIFPVRPAAKRPATHHGVKDATTDAETITAWWTRWPNANIGLACGVPFGDVLDVDVKGDAVGMNSFLHLRSLDLVVGGWAIQRTPTNGIHVAFAPSGLGCPTLPAAGLDVRGRGGYVLAAPSVLEVGRYTWVEITAENYGPPLRWDEIRTELTPRTWARRPVVDSMPDEARLSSLVRFVAAQHVGSENRNNGLFWAAMTWLEAGGDAEGLAQLGEASRLGDREVTTVLASARRRAAA